MEYVDRHSYLSARDLLVEAEADLRENRRESSDNYATQILDFGFSMEVRIRKLLLYARKIVYIDLGMERLTPSERSGFQNYSR